MTVRPNQSGRTRPAPVLDRRPRPPWGAALYLLLAVIIAVGAVSLVRHFERLGDAHLSQQIAEAIASDAWADAGIDGEAITSLQRLCVEEAIDARLSYSDWKNTLQTTDMVELTPGQRYDQVVELAAERERR